MMGFVDELRGFAPAAILLATSAAVLLTEPRLRRARADLGALAAFVGLAFAGLATILVPAAGPSFDGAFVHDRLTIFLTQVAIAAGGLATLLASAFQRSTGYRRAEIYALIPLAAVGVHLAAGARDLVALALSIETVSLAGYAIFGFQIPNEKSRESMMKSLLLGGLSSTLFWLGVAMLFGASGATRYAEVASAIESADAGHPLVIAGTTLLLAGIGFRLTVFPFCMAAPDVLQGAPAPSAAFASITPLLAGFGGLIRFFEELRIGEAGFDAYPALWVIAASTMILGNLVAIYQDNVKRMLAYATIGHAGFLFMGITVAQAPGVPAGVRENVLSAVLFYLAGFAFLQTGAFTLVSSVFFGKRFGEYLAEFRGLGRRCPVLGFAFLLILLSLAGFPPTFGFLAKLQILGAAMQANAIGLALAAVLASALGLYFYLRVVVVMYFRVDPNAPGMIASPALRVALAVVTVVAGGLGIFPAYVLASALASVRGLL